MEGPIRAKLEVARDVLSVCGDSVREGLSVVHSKAVSTMLRPIAASFDENQKSDLSLVISAVPWFDAAHGDDVHKVLLGSSKSTVVMKRATARRDMQHFRGFTNYFTEAEWNDILLNGESSINTKMDCICQKLVDLGGRCIDEHTKVEATELLINTCGLTPGEASQKVNFKNAISKKYKRLASAAGDPEVYLQCLPAPSAFKAKHPAFYDKLYSADAPPVRCMINEVDLEMACSSTKCRNPEVLKTNAPVLNLGSLGTGRNTDALENFGGMLFKGLQQMQEAQAKMMEVMLNGGRGPPTLRDAKPPQLDRQYEPQRRMLLPPPQEQHKPMVIMPPQKALMDGAPALPSVVLPPARPLEAAPSAAPSSRPDDAELKRRRERAAAFAKKASADPPPKRPRVGDVIKDMLKERAKENVQASKEVAKTAKAHVEAKAAATPKSPTLQELALKRKLQPRQRGSTQLQEPRQRRRRRPKSGALIGSQSPWRKAQLDGARPATTIIRTAAKSYFALASADSANQRLSDMAGQIQNLQPLMLPWLLRSFGLRGRVSKARRGDGIWQPDSEFATADAAVHGCCEALGSGAESVGRDAVTGSIEPMLEREKTWAIQNRFAQM